MQPFRRTGEVEFFGYGEEATKVPKFHRSSSQPSTAGNASGHLDGLVGLRNPLRLHHSS